MAGPWELGGAARRAQVREACEDMRSLTQGLAASIRPTTASMRGFEQESRHSAATWQAMGAAIPVRHSSGDDVLLHIAAHMAASNGRMADQEERFASETDQQAADLDAMVASRCVEHGL